MSFYLDNFKQLQLIINEQAKLDIKEITEFCPDFVKIEAKVREIIEKPISITNTIQELMNDVILQSWVEQGCHLHRNQRNKCAFCGGDIKDNRWQEIDAHFSRESEDLRIKIRNEIKLLENSKLELKIFLEKNNINKDVWTFHT